MIIHFDNNVTAELGHSDVKTTMIYLQTVNLLQPKKLRSPLDIDLDLEDVDLKI